MEYNSNFSYAWRLTDEKYMKLSREEIKLVSVIQPNESVLFWNEKIINKIAYFPINKIYKNNQKVIANCGWGDESSENITRKLLQEMFGNVNNFRFYWDQNNSIMVNSKLFIKYWSDFCYPSDWGNIIYISPQDIYIYHEDILLKGKK